MRLLVLTASLVLLPLTAFAMPCETDADCDEGQVCAPAPASCPPCEAGAECPSCEPETSGECMDAGGGGHEFWSGVECETDADCPDLFSCSEEAVPCAMPAIACDCPDCPPDAPDCDPECSCPDPGDYECPDETVKICVYEPASCETDAECGEGFECYAEEICYGSSGGCACPGWDPDSGEEPAECTCDEEPVSTEECEVVGSYCAPKQVECQADADCPNGWECATFAMGGSGDVACACTTCACPEGAECDCETTCDCPETEEPEVVEETMGYCLPGGWGDVVSSAMDSGTATGGEAGGAGTPNGGNGGSGGGASGPSKGGLDDLLGGGAENFEEAGNPQAPGAEGGDGNGNVDESGSGNGSTAGTGTGSASGCAVAASAASGFAAIFAILLVAFAVLTRRAASREE